MKNRIKNGIMKFIFFVFKNTKIKNVIVFESLTDFTDNSRVFYEYLLKHKYHEHYRFYWFVNNISEITNVKKPNTKFVKIWNAKNKITFLCWIKYIKIVKNAKYIIHTNRNMLKINPNTKIIYLTHGYPTKKLKNRRLVNEFVDYIVVSPDNNFELYKRHYKCKKEKLLPFGFARNDIFFKSNFLDIKNKFPVEFKLESNQIITWLPTFRKSKYNNRVDSFFEFPLGIPIIYDENKLNQFNAYLKSNKIIILLKLNPAQDIKQFKNIKLSNFMIISDSFLRKVDVLLNELLMISIALITDYSSVFNDYLLLDKPIFFTIDDYEEYKKNQGFEQNDYLQKVPGEKIKNIDDFYNVINNLLKGIDLYMEKRLNYEGNMSKYYNGNSCFKLEEFLNLEGGKLNEKI